MLWQRLMLFGLWSGPPLRLRSCLMLRRSLALRLWRRFSLRRRLPLLRGPALRLRSCLPLWRNLMLRLWRRFALRRLLICLPRLWLRSRMTFLRLRGSIARRLLTRLTFR
jgi:hypothetical protein